MDWRDVNGLERIDPAFQKAIVRLTARKELLEQEPLSNQAVLHKSSLLPKSSAQIKGSSSYRGGLQHFAGGASSRAISGSAAASSSAAGAGGAGMAGAGAGAPVAAKAGVVAIRRPPPPKVKIHCTFRYLADYVRKSPREQWVPNPFTRSEMSDLNPPKINPCVQPMVEILEDLMPRKKMPAMMGMAAALQNRGVANLLQAGGVITERVLRPLREISDEKLSEVFFRLKMASMVSSTDYAAQKDVKFSELCEIIQKAADDPRCRVSGDEAAVVDGNAGPEEEEEEEEDSGEDHDEEVYPVPANVTAELREYQKIGFKWLCQNVDFGFGSILADDMGLGKTLQVLCCIQFLKNKHAAEENDDAGKNSKDKSPPRPAKSSKDKAPPFSVLVVCPTSLLENWRKEAEKFTPDLKVKIYHGSDRAQTFSKNQDFDVLITSIGLIKREQVQLKKIHWHLLVLDEAQSIKNPRSDATKAIKQIPAECNIAMSGTPVENRLQEYWSILDFVNRGYLCKTHQQFQREFGNPIEKDNDPDVLARFHRLTKPFILRRLKTDKNIIKDLPSKIYIDENVSLSAEQAALYKNVCETIMEKINDDNTEKMQKRGLALKMLLQLKQICDHPLVYLADAGDSGLLLRAAKRRKTSVSAVSAAPSTVGDALAAVAGSGAAVAGQLRAAPKPSPKAKLVPKPSPKGKARASASSVSNVSSPLLPPTVDGASSTTSSEQQSNDPLVARSGKCETLLRILSTVLAANEKAIIFTQYVKAGLLISQVLENRFCERFPFFHGGLTLPQRNQLVHDFQKPNSRTRAMVISLKAGGTGLNLTAASHVIHFDHWWNPAVEDQATDRAYRIGQVRNVMVYRLLSVGTMEERRKGGLQDCRNIVAGCPRSLRTSSSRPFLVHGGTRSRDRRSRRRNPLKDQNPFKHDSRF